MSSSKRMHAISPTREEDYNEWFQQVIKASDLAENSPVRGSMTIKPWGFSIWENIRDVLDRKIKETGHQNVYFPLFIPLSFLEKEAAHVEGFAKECAVVTHHRLEVKDGKLVPAGELEEPLVVRPTSEAIIGEAFSRWIQSWRDLPLLVNQWANIVRWELRPRLFLRTTEILWQEGHTAHATAKEAEEEALKMLEMYRQVVEEHLAIPLILGEKSPGERFPGADHTYTIEAMMQDRKAIQAGTAHDLGQNFAKAFQIRFNTKEEQLEYAYTTSWGVTTRLIGGVIMTHGDDDGLRLPPCISPYHIVILPILSKPEKQEEVLRYCRALQQKLSMKEFRGRKLSIHIDARDMRGGDKNWEWIKKGVPVRLEIGPKDIENDACMLTRRDKPHNEKTAISLQDLEAHILSLLEEMQQGYFDQALRFRNQHTYHHVKTLKELNEFFTPKNPDQPEAHGGFVIAKWCEDPETEKLLEEHKITIRCIPLKQSGTKGTCIFTGRPATTDILLAKAY